MMIRIIDFNSIQMKKRIPGLYLSTCTLTPRKQ